MSNPLRHLNAPTEQHKYIILEDRSVFHAKYYMTDFERQELIAELNVSALVLFEYYLRLACNEKNNPELSDATAVEVLGLKYHTVRKLRSNLEKAGWVKVVKLPRHPTTGHKASLYYLGKGAVREHAQQPGGVV